MDMLKILQKDQKVWDLFTYKEEYFSSLHDEYGRFPYYLSTHRNIFEPSASKFLVEQGYHAEYPDNKSFAVCLSHDIDVLFRSERTKLLEAAVQFGTGSFSRCIKTIAQMPSKKLPLWTFSDIMSLEEKYGARSSFYFMAENPDETDYNYAIEDCETIVGDLSDEGWEVGLHGGHTTYNNPDKLKEKKQRLEKVLNKNVVGYRNHFLRFQIPDTWEYLQSAGFHYDSTLGYADCIGFRNGMCHPFKPYNIKTKREIEIFEIPLTIMDGTLNGYMRLDAATSWEMTKQLIDTVEQYHGVISILWHNQNFIGKPRNFYEKILKYCREKEAWMTSGKEITNWVMHGQ